MTDTDIGQCCCSLPVTAVILWIVVSAWNIEVGSGLFFLLILIGLIGSR